jgi:hypothetical protein
MFLLEVTLSGFSLAHKKAMSKLDDVQPWSYLLNLIIKKSDWDSFAPLPVKKRAIPLRLSFHLR